MDAIKEMQWLHRFLINVAQLADNEPFQMAVRRAHYNLYRKYPALENDLIEVSIWCQRAGLDLDFDRAMDCAKKIIEGE